MAKELKKVKPTTQEDRSKTEEDILKKLPQEKIMKIPDDEIILLPISGAFKRNIDEIMHFIMNDMSAEEIIRSFTIIRKNFEGIEPEQIDMKTRCLYTLTSITTELNYQAAEQGKWVETDQTLGTSLDKIIQTDSEESNLSQYKQDRDNIKKQEDNRVKSLEKKIKEAKVKKKKSNED